jgi:glycosyltransferase involved in cell wall biosynthesis
MRIGLLSTSYPRRRGDPAGRFVAELARWLADHGDLLEVLAPRPARDDHPRVEVRPLRYALRPRLLYGAGAPDNLSRSPRAWLQAPALVGRLALACARRAGTWDGVLSHWLLPCGLVAARFARARPHLAVAHSSDVHLLARLPLAPLALAALDRPRTALVLTSEALRPTLLSLARRPSTRRLVERAEVVRMGIPAVGPAPGRERERGDQVVVLFVGRLVPVKGVDLLLRACAGLRGVKIVVMGEGPLRARLERLAATLGVPARFLGERSGDDKRAWLRDADLLVLPSVVLPDGRTDSAPVALLEAMAAGVPVIASRVGGNAELIEHESGGLLVPPGRIEPLREAIARLASDPALRTRLAAGGREVAARHTWEVVGPRIRRLLASL